MKTAEQWVDESRLTVNGTSRAELVKLVRAIQEDAREDGEIAKRVQMAKIADDEYYRRLCRPLLEPGVGE